MFVRIGNDISVQWAITHNGIPESLEGRKLNLQLSCMYGKYDIRNSSIVITSDTENYTGETRTKLITISTSKGGTVVQQLTVKQPSRKAYVEGEILVFTRAATVSVSSDSLTIEDSDITVTNETLII